MGGSANLFSYIVDYAWVPIALLVMSRLPAAKATITLYMAGVLLLPEVVSFKLPGVPEFAKQEIISLWVTVGVLAFHRDRIRSLQFTRTQKLCFAGLTLGVLVTILVNRDTLKFGPNIIPGHELYDTVHYVLSNIFNYILPFAVGAAIFRSSRELRVLMVTFVAASLLYSIPQIIELRLSPQLHRIFYGVHQHSFEQTMRTGGFRPMVLMTHGLAVSLLTCVAVVGSLGLFRARQKIGKFSGALAGTYLWILLSVSKSIAALLYSFLAVPLVLLTSPKFQVRVAALLAVVALAYPVARAVDLVPVDDIKSALEAQFGADRADSAMTRFENEGKLLERARERVLFGWGSYCRPCMFDKYTGDEISIRDGDWIIVVGDWGVVGFLSKFVLLLFPIFLLHKHLMKVPRDRDRRLLSALALMVALYVLDLLPNGNYHLLPFVLSGALFGCTFGIVREGAYRRWQQRQAIAKKARHSQAPVKVDIDVR